VTRDSRFVCEEFYHMDAVGLSLRSLSGCQKKKLISSSPPTKVFRQLYSTTVVVSFQSNHHIVITGRFHRSCGHTSIRATGMDNWRNSRRTKGGHHNTLSFCLWPKIEYCTHAIIIVKEGWKNLKCKVYIPRRWKWLPLIKKRINNLWWAPLS
jgi:hypothetical protein